MRDGACISNGTEIPADVCIIGSGPAGITAAWHLYQAGLKVVLIEGSRNFNDGRAYKSSWPDKRMLYGGVAEGFFTGIEPDFLTLPSVGRDQGLPSERERYYGGTSSHWGGQCRPLDLITFEQRPGPGLPGWPSKVVHDLTPRAADPRTYYDKAATFCKLQGHDFTAKRWKEILKASIPELENFDVGMWQAMGPPLNFATRTYYDEKTKKSTTIGDSGIDVILNASLLWIDNANNHVDRLRVASMERKPLLGGEGFVTASATEFTIKADAYVLACGAIENSRLLLLSQLGNDKVGRYLLCHPLSHIPAVEITGNAVDCDRQHPERCYLSEPEARLLNGEIARDTPWHGENGVTVFGRFVPKPDVLRREKIATCWFFAGGGSCYFEMTPDPENRVSITKGVDKVDPVFGQQQTQLHWQLTDRDQVTYETTTKWFQDAVHNLDVGANVEITPWGVIKDHLTVNGHHIGGTRMSDDPEEGVVDPDLKVHSLDNLYVAGSSVFPSAGVSNPTFTIIALSIRLAEHLKGLLKP